MCKYTTLRNNHPVLNVKKDAKEVIFTTISCMCDNVHRIRFKKNADGDFKMSGYGSALSNWQMKHATHDIEWSADEQKWNEVIAMINSGTSVIEKVQSR